jgi:integrase/recombinase XerD
MNDFKTFLKEKGMAPATIYQHDRYIGEFLRWLNEEGITPGECTYNDLLSWIDELKKGGQSTGHINRKLLSLRYWFSFFQLENKNMANPAEGLHLKSTKKT